MSDRYDHRYHNNMNDRNDRNMVFSDGRIEGEELATRHYPYLVEKDVNTVRAIAKNEADREVDKVITTDKQVHKELYTNGFIKGYIEKVEELEKKSAKPSPASTATLQGATVKLTRVERTPTEYVYYIELTDPGYIDGVQTTELVYPRE